MILRSLQNESNLLQLASMGNEQAFREIFDFYSGRLNSFIRRITHDDDLAEDILMDVFLKIWMSRTQLAEIRNFDSYLFSMARNRALNILKRAAHEHHILNELGAGKDEGREDTEQTVIYNDYRQRLHHALDQLPPQQKLVYTLSRDEGMKYDEIALEMNVSKNTVKSHLKKAMSTLRLAFSNYLFSMTMIFFIA